MCLHNLLNKCAYVDQIVNLMSLLKCTDKFRTFKVLADLFKGYINLKVGFSSLLPTSKVAAWCLNSVIIILIIGTVNDNK